MKISKFILEETENVKDNLMQIDSLALKLYDSDKAQVQFAEAYLNSIIEDIISQIGYAEKHLNSISSLLNTNWRVFYDAG